MTINGCKQWTDLSESHRDSLMIINSCEPCTAGTFNMCIVFIEIASVMKIMFFYSKLLQVGCYAVDLSYVQVNKCLKNNFLLVIPSNRTPTLSKK